MDIRNLDYIVMEGGGARGAAYLGAIKALEQKMAHRMTLDATIQLYSQPNGRAPGLLDYYRVVNTKEVPVIQGIAGASAGAITTFALGLGFNSEEIEEILNFDFTFFLSEVDAGRYRMIDEKGNLAIGQDKKNKTTGAKELAWLRDYKFDLTRDNTPVGNHPGKYLKRNLFVSLALKTIGEGIGSNVKQFFNLLARLFKVETNDVPVFWRGFYRWLTIADSRGFLAKIGYTKLFSIFAFEVVFPKWLKAPMKFDIDNIANIFADRGMYSGFRVREFFLNMVILALVRGTPFRRRFISYLEDEGVSEMDRDKFEEELDKIEITQMERRSEWKLGDFPTVQQLINDHLVNMSFRTFNAITGINYGMCVSNLTTDNPIYFGYEWTPDFPVMEAVAGSMSIPPAIKPIYNASDVVQSTSTKTPPFVNPDGSFELQDYYIYEHAVKLALAQELKNRDGITIDVNNTINPSAFLPLLKARVVGEFNVDTQQFENADPDKTTTVSYNGRNYTVDQTLCRFFYNAAFKGLYLDGGYRNNIPYNFFRMRNDTIKNVCAIKLDNSFPPELLDGVYNSIKKLLAKEDIEMLIAIYEFDILDSPIIKTVVEAFNKKLVMIEINRRAKLVFEQYMAGDSDAAQAAKDKKAIGRLVKETIKHYRKKHLTQPWAKPVAVLSTATNGYSYGAEEGQVHGVADHDQILSLYDYGVGVYDFDMSKVMPFIKMGQAEAEKKTLQFFS